MPALTDLPPIAPPPTPSAASATPAEWANYLTWHSLIDARRRFVESESISTASTAAQNARAQAEQLVAVAGQAAAAAQVAAAKAITTPSVPHVWSDQDLVRGLLLSQAEAGMSGAAALSAALDTLRVLRVKYPPAPPSALAPK